MKIEDQVGIIFAAMGKRIACEIPELLMAFQPKVVAGILCQIETYFGTEKAQSNFQCIQNLDSNFANEAWRFIPTTARMRNLIR